MRACLCESMHCTLPFVCFCAAQCGGVAEIDACGICNPTIPCTIAGPNSCNDDDGDGICDDADVDVGGSGGFIGGLLLGIVVGGVLGAALGPKLTKKTPASFGESDSLYKAEPN